MNDPTVVSTGDALSQANLFVQATEVSGTVWNDADGSANGTLAGIRTGDEQGTNAGALTAVLVDAETGRVLDSAPVDADGTYSLTAPIDTEVYVQITAAAAPGFGEPVGPTIVPDGWVNTSPMTYTVFDTGTTAITELDFGLERLPDTDDKTAPVVSNPGGSVQVPVPTLTGDDPEDGPYAGPGDTFVIVTLPPRDQGVLYYDGAPVAEGQRIVNYDPSKFTVDPAPGAVTVVFTAAAVDAAGKVDPTPATITIPFSVGDAASLAGAVWHDIDANGSRDADEPGIAGVKVVLTGVTESGESVTLTATTDANGNYVFGNLAPGTYTITQTQPEDFADGKDVLGTGASGAGTLGNDVMNGIVLNGGDVATNYDFGELTKPVDPPEPPDTTPTTTPPVVPPVTNPPVADPPGAGSPTTTSRPATPSVLARTGARGIGSLVATGFVLVMAGAVLLRQRRRQVTH